MVRVGAPQRLIIPVAVGAVSLLFLRMGGAPPLWLTMQAVGIAAALIILALPWQFVGSAKAMLVLIPVLIAATLFFDGADGIRRWLAIGPLRLHAGLLLVPLLMTIHARRADWQSALAVALVSAIVALQPDRATALALVVGTAIVAATNRGTAAVLAVGVALTALAVTLVRPDQLAPVALVEGVFIKSWVMAPWMGALTTFAALASIAAPLIGQRHLVTAATCAASWAALYIASLIGAYPVPLIGYGLSAWLGWALALRAAHDGTMGAPCLSAEPSTAYTSGSAG